METSSPAATRVPCGTYRHPHALRRLCAVSSPFRVALPARRSRGVLLAGCSAALTVSAHTFADGHLPQLATTVLLTVLIGWISTAAAERTRGFGGILLVLGSAQLVSHLVLGELSGHPGGGVAMLASHAVATVLTALVLAHAESMLAKGVAALRLLLPSVWLSDPPPRVAVAVATARPAGDGHVIEVLLRRVHRRRGPPQRC